MQAALQQHRAGNLVAAEDLYQGILSRAPNHPQALWALGVLNGQRGRGAEALELLLRASIALPSEATLWNDIGLAQLSVARPAEAADSFRKALALSADHFEARMNLARSYHGLRQWSDAVACLREAISKWPESGRAHQLLGHALMCAGSSEEACASLQRALELLPDDPAALGDLGISLFHRQRIEESASVLRRALALIPNDFRILHNLGVVLTRQRRLREAIALLRRALALRPDSFEARCNLGDAILRLGNLADGIDLIGRDTGLLRFSATSGMAIVGPAADAPP